MYGSIRHVSNQKLKNNFENIEKISEEEDNVR
jgi:hypothetical protein